MDRIVIVIME